MKKTVQDYRRTQTKHRKAKKGHGWTKLERIEMDCIWVHVKNVGPPFFKFMSVYIKMSFTQRENHSQFEWYACELASVAKCMTTINKLLLLIKLLCGLDFAK